MIKIKRAVSGAILCLFLATLLTAVLPFVSPDQTAAAGTVKNLSNILPPGEGTGDATVDSNTTEVVAANGKAYSVWEEATGAGGSYDVYLYDKTADTVTNLSTLLAPSNSVGTTYAPLAKTFSDGHVLVAWWEKNNLNQNELYIYDGRSGTVVATKPLMTTGWAATSGGTMPVIAIAPNDTYFVVYSHGGTRGMSDAFIYKSATNTVTHISGLYPGGYGSTSAFIDTSEVRVDSSNNAHVAIWEYGAADADAFLYESATDTVTDLSALRPAGASGSVGSLFLRLDSSTGKPFVAWSEAVNPPSAVVSHVYVYNGNTSTVTDVSALYGPGGYGHVNFHDTYWYDIGFEMSPANKPFVAWSWSNLATGKYDVFLYDGAANVTRNLTSKLPAGEGTQNGGFASPGFAADGTAFVSFEESSATNDAVYLYRGSTDSVTKLADYSSVASEWVMNTVRNIDRTGATPYVMWGARTGGDYRLLLYNPDTAVTTNITDLAAGVNNGAYDDQMYSFGLADNKPVILVSIEVAGQTDEYLYDDRDGTLTNLSALEGSGQGTGYPYYPVLAVDQSDDSIYAAWPEGTGLRGGDDQFFYSAAAPVTPPTITAISPSAVLVTGGTALTITGTSFTALTTLTIGGTSVSPTYVGPTTLTATAPAHAVGAVNVVVANGSDSATLTNGLTYYQNPVLSSVSPTQAKTDGTTTVTLTGSGFDSSSVVRVDGAVVGSSLVNPTTLRITAPAHNAGLVSVSVTNAGVATSTLANALTYVSEAVILQPASTTPVQPTTTSTSTQTARSSTLNVEAPVAPPVTTTTPPSSDVGFSVNLHDGQVIKVDRYYDVIVTIARDQVSQVEEADFYVGETWVDTKMPDNSGKIVWRWDTTAHPGNSVKVVLALANGKSVSRRFNVSLMGSLAEEGGLRGFLQSLPRSVIYATPFTITLFIPILVLALLYLIKRQIQEAIEQERHLKNEKLFASQKAMFIDITSHYLRTPLAVMQGAVSIAELQPNASANIWQKVKARTMMLQAKVEEILAASTQLLASIDNKYLSEQSVRNERIRIWLKPLFIIPLAAVGTLALGFNVLVIKVAKIDLALIAWIALVLFLVLMANLLFVIVSKYIYNKRRKEMIKTERAQRAEMDAARSSVVHRGAAEIGAVVNEINGNIKSLGDDKAKGLLANGCSRLNNLVDKFAMVEQLVVGKMAVAKPKEYSLQDMAQSSVTSLAPMAAQKRINIVAPQTSLKILCTRPEWVNQVFTSVLDNAVAYSPEGGSVSFSAQQERTGHASVKIRDAGPGMPKDKIDLLFQPFTRADSVERFNHEGMGLSLYLNKLIVAYLGGEIAINSRAGVGTEVIIKI